MPMLKLALIGGACACAYVSWASWSAGYPPEIALTRGVVAFMAVSLLGFIGELTAARRRPADEAGRPPPVASRRVPADERESSV